MSQDAAASIAGALGAPGSDHDEDESEFTGSQLVAAERIIHAIKPPFDDGDAKPSRVARAIEDFIRATMRKIEAED